MSDESLEVISMRELNGQPIEIVYHSRKSNVVDLLPLFEETFRIRDEDLESPSYKRFKKKGKNTHIQFTLRELIEAFGPSYHTDSVANFLESHLVEDDMQSEQLVAKVRAAKDTVNMVGVRYYRKDKNLDRIPHNATGSYFLEPVNIAPEELCEHARRAYPHRSFAVSKPTGNQRYYHILPGFKAKTLRGRDIALDEIKKIFADMDDPPAILLRTQIFRRIPETLHDIHILSQYNQPVEGLKVIRE